MARAIQLNNIQQRSDLSLSQYDLYKNKEYCDVTLCITDPQSCDQIYSIECHKLVLAAASSYFRDVLNAGEASSNVNMIDLGEGNVDVVKQVISFIYCGKCEVSSSNIVELYRYSLKWKLSNLEQLLTEQFPECLEANNIVAAFELVSQEGKAALEKEASRYFREHLPDVLTTEHFKQVSFTCLCLILKEGEMNIDSEDTLLSAVIDWLAYNSLSNIENEELWKLIKFEHLSSRYLLHELLDHPVMQRDPQRKMVKEAIHNLHTADKAASGTSPRYWGVKPVYDRLAKVTTENKICVYDDEKRVWEQVGIVPDWVDRCTDWCVSDDMVVLLGAESNEHRGKCAAVDMKRFKLVTQLERLDDKSKWCIGVAQIDSEIFGIGGTINNNIMEVSDSVKKLSMKLSANSWEEIEPLRVAVRSPLVFTYKQWLFVIGGVNEENEGVCTNQAYDTKQSSWHMRAPAPKVCHSVNHSGYIHNNRIHIFTEEHHMVYTIDTDSWTCTQYDSVGFHIQPVLHGDEILACVRATNIEEDEPSEYVCKRYDEASNTWSEIDIDVKDCLIHYMFFTLNK